MTHLFQYNEDEHAASKQAIHDALSGTHQNGNHFYLLSTDKNAHQPGSFQYESSLSPIFQLQPAFAGNSQLSIVAASLATGQQINDAEYMKLSHGTTLINDLVDLRSDIMRKQRENPVLRGIRDSACQYLSKQMLDCVTTVRELIESKQILAMVVMGFCNWAVMSSHHRVYELIHSVTERTELHTCKYDGLEEQYNLLVKALEPFGSLGPGRPHWEMKRMDLDNLYSVYRQSPENYIPWLADMVRLLLEPSTFREIVDVVHFPWEGDIGQYLESV
ncbi:hypothetical protein N8T08_003015 [Aspergillus melleus]|uniref:Uncharacterized protein n=1 Tax=Aspergillus melleus TaxID=138277 RepID=A0ACC3B830_9EURO|nr:hypothetical protein N8T08_003015 [Aspergillus melleus]